MRNTIKKQNNNGFTLLEIAIVMVLIGLVIAPAIALYQNYRIDKDWTETEEKLNIAVNELGGFRSIYSRYPCPASQTAMPGDANYGFEDCSINSAGSCVNGVCTYSSNIAGQFVTVGALPFKTLNLQESESYDTRLNRFRYAVTRDLTVSSTFTMSGGGIGIIDKTGTSIIDQPDTGHFVIISHGDNKIGGYTRAGLQSAICTAAPTDEQENCDADGVFLSGEKDNGFDDRIKFFSSIMPTEWQISATNNDEIHLKNINSFAVGADTATDLSTAEAVTVKTSPSSSGTVRASGSFYSATLCEEGANDPVDCFAPRLIAGSLNDDGTRLEAETTGGSGMSCYRPSTGEDGFLVRIENGQAICEDEIFASCPTGSFIKGVDANGSVICDASPAPGCGDQGIVTTCGDDRTLSGIHSGGYRQLYSGECRMITDYDAAYFATNLAGMDRNQIDARIDEINNEDRVIEYCGPNAIGSLIRDTYQCNSGEWSHISAHETLRPQWTFRADPLATGGWPAETGYSGSDPDNVIGNHDCWCREDYRVTGSYPCPSGFTGNQFDILKHSCPQTSHIWHTIYTDNSQCVCQPGTITQTQSCNSYYDEINNTSGTHGLSGNVNLTYDVACVDNAQVTASTPSNVDTSECYCPSNDPNINRSYCPTGTTNSWSWDGGVETGVEALSISNWICPDTTSGGLPDPGYWGTPAEHSPIPSCTCDTNLTDTVTQDCPSNLSGDGLVYEREWDCSINNWEAEENWELISSDCKTCSWTAPPGAASLEDVPHGKKVDSKCSCDASPALLCWDYGNNSDFKKWNGCQCTVQVD